MASLGHVAVGLAVARWADGRIGAPSRHLYRGMVLWSLVSLLPDADVIGFRLGVDYAAPWGHRGATHSLAFALAGGIVAYLCARRWNLRPGLLGALVAMVLASHGVLDTLTDGGLGVALLWPVSAARFFSPWRPIPVAPIGLAFFSERGLVCAATELVLFLPLWLWALLSKSKRRAQP